MSSGSRRRRAEKPVDKRQRNLLIAFAVTLLVILPLLSFLLAFFVRP